jgi:PAS domain S-box-containing protein
VRERRELHRQAAVHLERQPKPCPFQLAYHFDAAGQSRRALPSALAAAEQARAQHSLQIAEQQYRIAERGARGGDPATRSRVAEGLADVLMLQGRYDEVEEHLQLARELAGDRVVQARVEGKRGELAFKRGEMGSAIASLEQGLRLLGKRVPRWSASFLMLCCWEVLVQVLHSLLPRLFLARRPLAGADTELLVIRLYSRLAYAYWFERGRVPCLWAHLREMNLAERYPPTPELAQAYSEHAPVMSLLPYFRRGIAYAERSLAIRRALGDPWGQGQSLHFHGVVLYAASRFSECIEKCQEAVRLLRRTGDFWEVNIARYQIAASLYRLGDLEAAGAEARGIHQSGLELGDGQASGISLDVWAWSSEGKVPAELIRAELERPSKDAQRTAQVLVAQGVQLLGENRPAAAVAVLEQAHRVVRTADVRNAWVSPVLPWLATALRRQLEVLVDRTPQRRHALERRLRVVVRDGLGLARSFRNDLPHALRESALLAARQGRLRRARRLFAESLAVATRQGARHEHAQSLLAGGQVGLEAGWPTAADDVTQAERVLATLQVAADVRDGSGTARPVTLSLADRFDSLLDVGRRLASSLTREAITSAIREAGLRLLRGEHCAVLDVTTDQQQADLAASSSGIDLEYSRAMVQRALARGRAVAFIEGLPESTSESLLLSGMRSSLAAPILVRGRPAACFHVTHRQVARLFGADEERLADFISTLASAAMENAENFDELRRLNESLELRIRERKEAEKRIQEQAALLDKARDAIVVLDLDDRVLYWNLSAERLYGWKAAEAFGQSAAELFRGPAVQLEEASKAVRERGEWTGEMQQVTRSGEKITVESRWTLVRDDDGRPTSRLLVNTDITEKKRVESQLHRAQRMESIGTLAGGIAHDLNNMLAPILMATDLIRGQNPSPAVQPFLDIIHASAERGAAMVRQILSFARGAEGQRVMVQLKHLVRDLEKVLTSTFPKSITVETHLPHDVGVISGDATQLYQVVMNLCVNARDAMPQGGRMTISVENQVLDAAAARLHPSAAPGRYVVLHVADTGTGIPPEILERIFDPFFTTKEVGKGTGLGLSTVVGIVRGHGGFVTIASEVGKGTTFSVYLPATAEETSARTEGAYKAARGQGELVLVVDDEAPIRQLITSTLEGQGYRVKAACEGNEALKVYAENAQEVRLLLTDMMMPVMDGPATIRALREVAPRLPVLVTSGFVDPAGQTLLTSEGGVQGFLPKPFSAEQLLAAVEKALRGR